MIELPNGTPEPVNKIALLEKLGVKLEQIPDDTTAILVITKSTTLGLNVGGSTINDRIEATGMMKYGYDNVLVKYWAQQDYMLAQKMEQERQKAAVIQNAIMGQGGFQGPHKGRMG